MRPVHDSSVDPRDRHLLELARVFAEGVIRLHKQGRSSFGPNGISFENTLESSQQDLEMSRQMSVSVTRD